MAFRPSTLRASWLAAALCGMVLGGGGCPTAPAVPGGLSATQAAATEAVAAQIAATGRVAVTWTALTEEALDPDDIAPIGQFGSCPAVVFVASAPTAAIQFDFGTGCTAGAQTVAGALELRVTRTSRTLDVTFDEFRVAERAVTGAVSVALSRLGDSVTLAGEFDLATAGVGALDGSGDVTITRAGVVSINSADATVTAADGTAYRVVLDGCVIDPATHGNFIPQAGTATFELPTDGAGPDLVTVVVRFDADSPSTGVVRVQVGTAPAVDFTLPDVDTL